MYVENFQGYIKNFEYNFSTKYKIKYDNVIQDLVVQNQENNNVPKFFGDNIENVTAIIGKNGAGKSSILRVLSMKYTGLKKREDNYLLVYHVRDNIFYIELFEEQLYKLKIKCREQYNNKIKPYLKGVYVELYGNKFILSNTSNHVIKDTCILASLNTVVSGYGTSQEKNTITRIGLIKRLEYTYRFLAHAKDNKYGAYKNDISIDISISNKYKFEGFLANVKDEQFSIAVKKFSMKESFIFFILYQQIKRISLEVINYYSKSKNKKDINNIRNIEAEVDRLITFLEENNYEKSFNYAEEMYKKILRYIDAKGISIVNEEENVIYLMNILEKLNNLDENYFIEHNLSIEIESKEDKKVVDFLSSLDECKYKRYSDIMDTLHIKINHLSDGEREFIDIFSSLHSQIGDYENIILVLDEPDKSFHPEWSRQFITYLKDNLGLFDINKTQKKYQIILTTHSPFIASDLPKENILMIEDFKIKDIDLGNTFGANIHTLLSNQFFMESTIGEFARKKINECIIELNKKIKDSTYEIDSEKKNEIKYIIKNIGEHIIKNKLSNMYKEAFPANEEDYTYKIKRLEEEKYKLENLLKDKKLDNIDQVMELLKRQINELKKKCGENK